MTQIPSWGLIWLIRTYRYLSSPLLGPSSRFTPNCSVFGVEAFQQHGLASGSRLLRRLFWHADGLGPIPPAKAQRAGVASR